jgi:hypothetical protein
VSAVIHGRFEIGYTGKIVDGSFVGDEPCSFTATCECGRWSCRFDGVHAEWGPFVAFKAHAEHIEEEAAS